MQEKENKMPRQLKIYYILAFEYNDLIGPKDLMIKYGISRRTLERDLKDLTDSGLLRIEYDSSNSTYIGEYINNPINFPDNSKDSKRRLSHLVRLKRLGTLIKHFQENFESDMNYFYDYEEAIDNYTELKAAYNQGDPNVSRTDLKDAKEEVELQLSSLMISDLVKEYYLLFPDSNERTRQRDFKELNDAGFCFYHFKKIKGYAFIIDTERFY